MSRVKCIKLTPHRDINFNTLDSNLYMPESLAEYVTRIMLEKNLSGYDVERASKKRISQTHTNRIQNGDVVNPSAQKLKGLALGLGVPEHELFAVARGLSPDRVIANERLAAIERTYDTLNKVQQKKADYIIEVLEREMSYIANERSGELHLPGSGKRQTVPVLKEPAR